jgi:hypothetical protein
MAGVAVVVVVPPPPLSEEPPPQPLRSRAAPAANGREMREIK